MSLPFKYKSKGHTEHGIYVEVYLPKRAKFQGTLYQTLTNGFKHKFVQEHFLDKTKKSKIIELLKHHEYQDWTNYTTKYVDSLDSLYWGYSMYEVDGVFKPKRGNHVDEERTQVIRIMFLPQELDAIFKELKIEFDSKEHRCLLNSVGNFLRSSKHIELREKAKGNEKQVLNYIYDWYKAVGFFLFGYIIYEICSKIEISGDNKETDYEKEVWLTSFWHFNVNRIEFIDKNEEISKK
jgi:hypothetical protein